jgi:hypothetical protein
MEPAARVGADAGYAEYWHLKKQDGRAEAALIALWGLCNRPGMGAGAVRLDVAGEPLHAAE